VVLVLAALLFGALFWRLGYLFIVQRQFLESEGNVRTVRTMVSPAYRGMICDRHAEPLAVSTPVESIWIDPRIPALNPRSAQNQTALKRLSQALDIPLESLKEKLYKNKTREFLYLKRQQAPDVAEKIRALKIPGVYVQREFRRYYPSGEITAQVVGLTNVDELGIDGVEYSYNSVLAGVAGKERVLRDRLGHVIKSIEQTKKAEPGQTVSLSLDLRIQYLAYRILKDAVAKHHAVGGLIGVLDIQTGEVLAMVNQPSFNPNDRLQISVSPRNRAVTDTLEPGSLMKPFAMASVLESKQFPADYIVQTSPGSIMVGRDKVKDIHNYGPLSLTGVIKKSSNVGITQLVLASPPEQFTDLLYRAGFGQTTDSGFPGEASGWLNPIRPKESFKLATMAFGYGLAVTPLQLLSAYGAFGNGGYRIPVTFLKEGHLGQSVPRVCVFSKETAFSVLTMLNAVTQPDGSGRRARIPGYEVAGKTGTTQRLAAHGYDTKSHNALFLGMAPYPAPRLAIVVALMDPQMGAYYGGEIAAPVFAEVMSGALRLLDIAPQPIFAHNGGAELVQQSVSTVASPVQSKVQ
jgi:cell division protein FtsI (penicillin-binding protein 3)